MCTYWIVHSYSAVRCICCMKPHWKGITPRKSRHTIIKINVPRLIKPTLLQWCIQAKGGSRCPPPRTTIWVSFVDPTGPSGLTGIVSLLLPSVSWSDLFRSSIRLGKSTDGCLTVLWCGGPASANYGCMTFLGAGWTLTFFVASDVAFLAFLFWPLEEFSGPERDDPAIEVMLFLAVCLFLLGGFIMIPDGYGFV